jgi:hypothetical protein
MLLMSRRLRVGRLLLGALPVFGQALHVSSVSGVPGEKIAVDLSLDSPAGHAPAALKWVTVFPARLLELESKGPDVGSSAKKSGKSVTCAMREAYSYVCVLAGGPEPIANGLIATFHFKIRADAHPGTSVVKIDQVDAVTTDLKTLKLIGTEGNVAVR